MECQILEDLSLDAEAFRTRMPCSNGGAPQAAVIDCEMNSAPARCSTVAEAQLQDLLYHAMQQVRTLSSFARTAWRWHAHHVTNHLQQV